MYNDVKMYSDLSLYLLVVYNLLVRFTQGMDGLLGVSGIIFKLVKVVPL